VQKFALASEKPLSEDRKVGGAERRERRQNHAPQAFLRPPRRAVTSSVSCSLFEQFENVAVVDFAFVRLVTIGHAGNLYVADFLADRVPWAWMFRK
jgi:hypothetical protein